MKERITMAEATKRLQETLKREDLEGMICELVNDAVWLGISKIEREYELTDEKEEGEWEDEASEKFQGELFERLKKFMEDF